MSNGRYQRTLLAGFFDRLAELMDVYGFHIDQERQRIRDELDAIQDPPHAARSELERLDRERAAVISVLENDHFHEDSRAALDDFREKVARIARASAGRHAKGKSPDGGGPGPSGDRAVVYSDACNEAISRLEPLAVRRVTEEDRRLATVFGDRAEETLKVWLQMNTRYPELCEELRRNDERGTTKQYLGRKNTQRELARLLGWAEDVQSMADTYQTDECVAAAFALTEFKTDAQRAKAAAAARRANFLADQWWRHLPRGNDVLERIAGGRFNESEEHTAAHGPAILDAFRTALQGTHVTVVDDKVTVVNSGRTYDRTWCARLTLPDTDDAFARVYAYVRANAAGERTSKGGTRYALQEFPLFDEQGTRVGTFRLASNLTLIVNTSSNDLKSDWGTAFV